MTESHIVSVLFGPDRLPIERLNGAHGFFAKYNLRVCLPKTGSPCSCGHLSKGSPSYRAPRLSGGMGLTVSTEAVERLGSRE